MTLPKVTIVTVTSDLIKNGREEFFRQCVESVYNQQYPFIEHIVIDNASKDGTKELLDEYVQKGYISYLSESDKGVYEAMNKGLYQAQGKYIAFLNSDDFYHDENAVQASVFQSEKENASFSYADCRYLSQEGAYLGDMLTNLGTFFMRMPFSHQSMLINTDVMRELGGFDTQFKSAADYDFVIRLCLNQHKGVQTPLNFVTFRAGGYVANKSNSKPN